MPGLEEVKKKGNVAGAAALLAPAVGPHQQLDYLEVATVGIPCRKFSAL